MRIGRLKPWPFNESENVALYWLTSPFTGSGGRKILVAYFQTDKGFKSQRYPWGTLPLLKTGFEYKDGLCLRVCNPLVKGVLSVQSITKHQINTAYDLIKPSHYPLRDINERKNAGFEYCAKISVRNRLEYIIPCMELVRAIFASTRFFTNQLLSTSALDECSMYEDIKKDWIDIEFSSDYPLELFNDAHISEYVWQKHTDDIYNEWKGIYARWVSKQKIIMNLPLCGEEKIHYYGLKYGNTTLILNMAVSNIVHPFQYISATHPNRNANNTAITSSQIQYIENLTTNKIDLEGGDTAARKGRATLLDNATPTKQFRNNPKVDLASKKQQGEHRTRSYVDTKTTETHTMQETLLNGKACSGGSVPGSV